MARKIRFNFTANNGDSFLSVAEKELRDVIGGADQTSPATPVTASSVFGATRAANKVVDNSDSERWATASNPTYPVTLDITMADGFLPAQYTIRAQVESGGAARAPQAWTVEYSDDDGSTWTTIDTRSGETGWANGETRAYELQAPSVGGSGINSGVAGLIAVLKEVFKAKPREQIYASKTARYAC